MVKLSIIIPHWNCYDLLVKLLNELEIQFTTDDVEIIVIDDSNEERLNEYENIANIIHNEQRVGLSKARNIGLDLAKGKYVAFIDADDMVTNDYMEVLLKAIDEHDEDITLS